MPDINALLLRLRRWPRRLAALGCLLLAAGTALSPDAQPPAGASTAALRRGQLAVPIALSPNLAASVQNGDRIDLLAAPSADAGTGPDPAAAHLVVRDVRVLSVRLPSGGFGASDSAVVVVALSRAEALDVTRFAGRDLLVAVADDS